MPDNILIRDLVAEYLPGIGVLILGAVVAWIIGSRVPGADELLVAIIIGVVLANSIGFSQRTVPGIRTHKIWLGAGIVLMGASVAFDRIIESGLLIGLSVIIAIIFTIFYVEILSRVVFGINEHLSSLLAAGASVCGVSAIVAIAGSINANKEHIAYAAATVLLFDALTLVIYPVIGRLLNLSAQVFGLWAGVTMFSTGPVVAVGFAHSETAGQWATVTKLSRNALIGLVAVAYATYYARKRLRANGSTSDIRWQELWDRFPKFVIGFLLLAVVASTGLLSAQDVQSLENAYGWLFLLAFVGLGTDLKVKELRRAGFRPVLVVLVAFATVSTGSLLLLMAVLG